MLSIGRIGNIRYYTTITIEDYYSRDNPDQGIWLGQGAKLLGLPEKVDPVSLERLLQGYAPD